MDKQQKSVSILELTCPAEHRLDIAHRLKKEKYNHFERDIRHFKTEIIPFEIGSHSGYVSSENKTRLKVLHKFCKKSIKLKQFINNISAICLMSSYYIFNCRGQDLWPEMAPILAPLPNQWFSKYSFRKKPLQWPAGRLDIITGVPGSLYPSSEACL